MNSKALCVGLAFVGNSQSIEMGHEAPAVNGQRVSVARVFGNEETMSSNIVHPFSYEDPEAAVAFMSNHERVRSLLPFVRSQVDKVFGARAGILVRVSNDYETGEKRLVARIQYPGDFDEALDLFSKFGRQWWYAQPLFVEGDLVMDIEAV